MTNSMQERFDEKIGEHLKIVIKNYSSEICGDIKSFIQQEIDIAVAERDKEIVDNLSRLTRYCRSKFILHKAECCNHYVGVEAEPVVDMLLEEEVLSLLTNKKQINSLEK